MRGLWRRVQEIVWRTRLAREIDEELADHVARLVAHKVRAGMPPQEAQRQARMEAGSVDTARAEVAEGRTGFAVEQLLREAAYTARVLGRSPGLTLVSITTMGIGIGATTLLFALVNGIVLQPLPYPDAHQLVRIFDTNPPAGIERAGAASGNIDDWRRRTSAFDGIAGFYAMGRTLSTDTDAEVLITAQVSQDFFPLMRVAPLLGRAFTDDDIRRAAYSNASSPVGPDPVVILSYGVWRQRYGGDPNVVGSAVTLERRPFTIVGVMPDGFAMPAPGVQLWIPWNLTGDLPRDQHYLGAVARLKPQVTPARAGDQLNGVARALALEHPVSNGGWGVRVLPLQEEAIGDTAAMLWVLLGAVALVLLVACANVALLCLLRGLDRAGDAAVRLALGASAGRLLREFLMESALLAVGGGALGVGLAVAGLRVLPALTLDLPRLNEVSLDLRALGAAGLLTALAAVLSGLPHAWRRSRMVPATGLSGASRRTTDGGRAHVTRDLIVIAQVALAVMLMAGSGLLVRSFLRLRAVDPGFDPRGVLVAPVFLDSQAYTNGDRTRAYYRTLFERLAALPGVVAVGGATTVPTSPLGPDFERPVWPEGAPSDGSAKVPAAVRMITPGYVPALGLRVVEGRAVDDRDRPEAPRVVMVSRALAARLWPGQSAVGRQLVVDYSTAGTYPYEVVGVMGDVRFRGPRSESLAEIYLPHAQRPYLILNVVLKATGDPRALIPAVRGVLSDLDPAKPAHGLYALEDLVGATYARDRQAMLALVVFAGAAIGLAVLSVYGALAQRVRERAREIAIRMAVGAGRSGVVGWVALAGLRLIAIGIVAGLAGTWTSASALEGLLFGVAPTDALTTAVVVASLAGVGVVTTLVPAWRASRIDPVVVLRGG